MSELAPLPRIRAAYESTRSCRWRYEDMSGASRGFRDRAQARRPAMTELLADLVAVESPSGYGDGVRRVARILAQRLKSVGLEVELVPSERFGVHLVASAGASAPGVVLVGHLDTVFPVGSAWPFSVEGSIATGPGVADMKGGLVVLVNALELLAESDGLPPLRIVLAGDEEVTSPESRHIIADQARHASYGLVFEPGEPDGALINRRKGFGHYTLTIEGRAAHAGADPAGGVDANSELVAQCEWLYGLAVRDRGTTINVGRIEGGRAPAIISESARAEIDIRVETEEERTRLERELSAVRAKRTSAKIQLHGGFERPPLIPDIGTEQLMALALEAGKSCGQTVTFSSSGGVSDANTLADAAVPALDGLGPIGGRLHSRDEWADLDSLTDRVILSCSLLSALSYALS